MTAPHTAVGAYLTRRCVTCGEPCDLVMEGLPGRRTVETWAHVSDRPVTVETRGTSSGPGRICSLCGAQAGPGMVVETSNAAMDSGRWRGLPPTGQVEYVPVTRCVRRQECRNRLEETGGKWPLIEGKESRTTGNLPPTRGAKVDPVTAAADPLEAF